MATRILLVDDHAILREGVEKLLGAEPDMQVVGSTGDSQAAIVLAQQQVIDVAIVDMAIPGMNGVDLVLHLLDVAPQMRILMLSMYANPEYVCRAIQAGAQGYVLKDDAGVTLVEAVRAVRAGQSYFCSKIDMEAVAQCRKDNWIDLLSLLSPRERQALQLTVEGSSIAETARRIGVSPKTIETYRSRVMTKLGIDNMPDMVRFAIRHGITNLD